MKREWRAGDVASVLTHGTQPAFRTGLGWTYIDGSTASTEADEHNLRPLVVIDPEDREQVELLYRAYVAQGGLTFADFRLDYMQAALRSLIEPPKPEEPTDPAVRVCDREGDHWARIVRNSEGRWVNALGGKAFEWGELLERYGPLVVQS